MGAPRREIDATVTHVMQGGLRQSEMFGLKWSDIDFAQRNMYVTGSIVYAGVGPCKMESSQRPVPIHPILAEALPRRKRGTRYSQPNDWVFASKRYQGRRPIRGQAIFAPSMGSQEFA